MALCRTIVGGFLTGLLCGSLSVKHVSAEYSGIMPYWESDTQGCQARIFTLSLEFDKFLNLPLPRPPMSYLQKLPIRRHRYMVRQPSGSYEESSFLPCEGKKFLATITRRVFNSTDDQIPTETKACFERMSGDPLTSDPWIYMTCVEGADCVHDGSVNGIMACGEQQGSAPSYFGLIKKAWAAVNRPYKRGWVVPTIETLRSLSDNDLPGYTRFSVSNVEPIPIAGITHYTFGIWVNETPIYFDGRPHYEVPLLVSHDGRISFEFPLQNLVFSGARAGSDQVDVGFRIYAASKLVSEFRLSGLYEALRDMKPTELSLIGEAPDIRFRWTASYIAPLKRNKYEVFVYSTLSREDALRHRRSVDNLHGTVAGRPVVGVVRPPLGTNPYYGVVLGLRQEMGQVQFTYDSTIANQLCSWSLKMRESPEGRKLIDKNVNRFENQPRAEGVKKFQFCRNLMGN